ncbi:type II toxin-antitoxin system prevent-host-death family antitoxin [Clostridium kluyveri]|uniref:type II toxin-antitoxin system prevent-host-death family antitoxin n=1 Tax=Clostridium kluyveri TaxID=1534 RepID=UPI000396D01E|nr:type II toxin-antitoxin system prevent-host-death family antitoxin [Clostridium kluyveri]ERI90678.1 prevent-host-death family protein [Clostridiales bacterium oral taxon 876 str. F0540]UZQ48856.1 type II toxin-antitoxin system prevent-host-death family antitoxin [Clostridium kluyveri]
MPNIKPISDLRNYNEVLRDCQNGEPVFLTKNGRGKYVLVDIEEYEKQQTILKLLSKLNEAEEAIKIGDEWQTLDDLKRSLGV